MAMELFVFSDEQLETVADWQAAIDADEFPLRLGGNKPIKSLNGLLPAMLRKLNAGFECNLWPAPEIMSENPGVDFGHEWKYALAFRWGNNLYQMPAAWMAAVAYARATKGVIFDEEQGVIRSVVDARAIVADIERELPEMEALVRELTNDQ